MTTIGERVAAGAAWLDEHRPFWVDRIDLGTLDLGEPCRCVLGQEYGGYIAGRCDMDGFEYPEWGFRFEPAWGPGTEVAVSRGFHAAADMENGDVEVEYAQLTDAWRALILQRRAAVTG